MTMTDVAARAGVSLKTVSRVVNNEPHVRPLVEERVRTAIRELGYRPDSRARDLATAGPGRLLGYVQVDAANPFFASVYRGLEDVVREADFLVIAGSTDADATTETALVEAFTELRVVGIVVAAARGSDELLRREIAQGVPVVCVDRLVPGLECDTVVADNREGTAAAVTHLWQRGHRRIAFLGGDPQVWTASERLAGYRQALHTLGGEAESDLVVVDVGDASRADVAARRLLVSDRPPTAMFCAQDRITAGVIAALHAEGRQHDIAVFGFDEIPFAAQLDPSVSVVAQDPYGMGRSAGQLLVDRLEGRRMTAARMVVPTQLRHRASGDIRPSRG